MSAAEFETATEHAQRALEASERLPAGPYRRFVIEDLRAAISWIRQAHNEWAQRKASE